MIGIYARQSIEKENSISIDFQISHCKNIIQGESKEYVDKGYSGSNINRPAFEQLMNDIKDGLITAVYCYRLDRISRNILDFANLQEFFKKHNCSFVSSSENLDTTSPMGRAMVNIIMVFAQLERETIAGRVRDSWYARAKLGSFVGGGLPFGYSNTRIENNGKQMSVLIPDENADTVKFIFNRYLETGSVLGVAKELNNQGKNFYPRGIWRILTNPVYVSCMPDLYYYYFSKGYQIYNSVDDFNGEHGCLLVGKETGRRDRVYNTVDKQTLIIGAHSPLISSEIFLEVQDVLSKNKLSKRSGTSARTWLSGLLKCPVCGYAVTFKGDKKYGYLVCSGYLRKVCTEKTHHRPQLIESIIEERLIKYINETRFDLTEKPDIKIEQDLIKINQQIENLTESLVFAQGTAAQRHIIDKINELEASKAPEPKKNVQKIVDAAEQIKTLWGSADIKTKQHLASIFIKSINIKNGELNINWIM